MNEASVRWLIREDGGQLLNLLLHDQERCTSSTGHVNDIVVVDAATKEDELFTIQILRILTHTSVLVFVPQAVHFKTT